jgi:quercetin dioxygenase-like cupin family protein
VTESTYDANAPLVTSPPRPEGVSADEWRENLSEPARYGGVAADRAREQVAVDAGGEAAHRFREILVQTQDLEWVEKTLAGLTHKALWRNEDTGASISLVRFQKGSGIPSRHSHASNQFMLCLSGRYLYVPSGITLTAGSFYWNPKGSLHGPTLAEEDSVLVEVYDGPHYPTQPDWYSSPDDAR